MRAFICVLVCCVVGVWLRMGPRCGVCASGLGAGFSVVGVMDGER